MLRIVGFSVCALVFSSCGSIASHTERRPVRSLLEIRQHRVIVQKWDISCGAAALATVLTYGFDDPVSERSVAAGMLRHTVAERVNRRGGFSFLDLKRFAENRGYVARAYRGLTTEHLVELPNTIVPIRTKGYDHFVVVRRIGGNQVDLADPAFGNRTMTLSSFRDTWIAGLGFVVAPAIRREVTRALEAERKGYDERKIRSVLGHPDLGSDVKKQSPRQDMRNTEFDETNHTIRTLDPSSLDVDPAGEGHGESDAHRRLGARSEEAAGFEGHDVSGIDVDASHLRR